MEHGHCRNTKMLLHHGASVTISDFNGMTPSDLADKSGHSECTLILKEAAGKLMFNIFIIFIF